MSVRPIWRALVPLTALATLLGLAASAQASTTQAAKAKPKGTEISVANTVFGPALVVGSGPYKGFQLYFISSDNAPYSYGCVPGVTKTPVGPITCTGPSNDKNAEWPAITTTGKPVAGPGVSAGAARHRLPQGRRHPDHLPQAPAVPLRPDAGPGQRGAGSSRACRRGTVSGG